MGTSSSQSYSLRAGFQARPPAPAPEPVPTGLPGDLNGDNKVDLDDLQIVVDALGTSPPLDPRADVNGDDLVDIRDLSEVSRYFGTSGPIGPIEPPAGMVSWWTGDGHADDIIDGNHGTLEGGATFAPGMVDQAFSLDGDGDYVAAPFVQEGPFTVDFWAKADVPDQAKYTSAFSSANPGHYNPFFQIEFDGFGNYRFQGGNDELQVNIGPVATAFQHIAVTYDGSTVRTYLDGEFGDSGTWAGTSLSFEIVKIGMNRDNVKSFDGLIDEVEIFNRALSGEEIRVIYNAGSAGKIKP